MNKLQGTISEIETSDRLSLVEVALQGEVSVQVVLIETPDTSANLRLGAAANVLFKETEVHLAKGFSIDKISLQNALPATILGLQGGKLLTRAELRTPAGPISALVPTRAAKRLQLKPEMDLFALVSFSEIMLAEV